MATPEKELKRIETLFNRLASKRITSLVLKTLEGGKTLNVTRRTVTDHSRTHAQLTNTMLNLIERYAKYHQRIHGEVTLPMNMARELERLSRRRAIRVHPQLPQGVITALNAHRNRLDTIFDKAEAIRVRYRLNVPRAHTLAA